MYLKEKFPFMKNNAGVISRSLEDADGDFGSWLGMREP